MTPLQGDRYGILVLVLLALGGYGEAGRHAGRRRSVLDEKLRDCLRLERSVRASYTQEDEILRERVHNVEAQHPAYLHCHLPKNHSNALVQVAWTRAEDSALLTAGDKSFTTDPRFQVSMKSEHDWVLIIRRAEVSDSGCYLCEVNTEPASTVYAVYLHVKEPPSWQKNQVRSVPPTAPPNLPKKTTRLYADMHGDEVILNCTVTLKEDPPAVTSEGVEEVVTKEATAPPLDDEVKWTRDGNLIDLTNSQKYEFTVRRSRNIVVETVRIRKATSDDDGRYACESQHQVASHILHVNAKAESLKSSRSSGLTAALLVLILIRI